MPTTAITSGGMQILVEALPHTHSISIGCFMGVGARHEPTEMSGVSHFIEHMCFKGSKSLPTARQISQAIEGVGGILNASTAYESTVYWGKVADIHFDRAIHVLTDMLRYPLFEARELEKERRVIIEEIRGSQDSPSDWVHELLQAALWGNQPLGRDIAGSVESVSALTRGDLVDFWRKNYGVESMVVSVAGNVDTQQIIDAVSRHFEGFLLQQPSAVIPSQPPLPGPQLHLLSRESEQGHFCMGFPSLSYNDADRRALQVLDTVLGGGMSSRLFQEVREERGLAYDIGSYHSEVADAGMWAIYGSVEPAMLRDTLTTTMEILHDLIAHGVTPAELTLVKEQVKGGILLSLEDTWAVASRNGSHQLRYKNVIPVEQVVAEVEAVTADDILRVAQRILRNDALHLTVIGPYSKADERDLRGLIA